MKLAAALLILTVIVIVYMAYGEYDGYRKAVSEKNPKLCEKIGIQQLKDPCFSEVAIALMNSTYCSKSKDEDEANRCFGIIESNATFCERIKGEPGRGSCYNYVALRTGDSSLCDRLTDNKQMMSCRMKARTREKLGG
ncbi:MAG: hypothetical protein V1875_01385 [Candidatus Altiarchaeota archaeon]